jgi:pyruvate kinase
MDFTVMTRPPTDIFADLIAQVEALRQSIEQRAEPGKSVLFELPIDRRRSAENLLHYLALRSRDLRSLQDQLARLGLSSLGRVEAHVLATIGAVLHNLYLLSGREPPGTGMLDICTDFDTGADALELNTVLLLGQYPEKRRVYIMVTISTEAADDYLMVHQLLQSGMNCMRINCAHDDQAIWSRMIEHLRNAERVTGRSCRILMDLGGSKLRLGPMESKPAVLKIRPVRASSGSVLRPARIWLAPVTTTFPGMPAADACLALDPDWLKGAQVGSRISFQDARGSRRNWRIREVLEDGCWAEAKKTAYVANGTILQLQNKQGVCKTKIRSLPPKASVCLIRSGDTLLMSATLEQGKPAIHDSNGELLNPGRVSLTIPEVFRDARPGEPIFFDDGRIAGIIEKCEPEQLQVRITHTRNPVEKLEGNKGFNLPDTRLKLPALNEKDLQDLEFAAGHADMIGLSFADGPEDVRTLHKR